MHGQHRAARGRPPPTHSMPQKECVHEVASEATFDCKYHLNHSVNLTTIHTKTGAASLIMIHDTTVIGKLVEITLRKTEISWLVRLLWHYLTLGYVLTS